MKQQLLFWSLLVTLAHHTLNGADVKLHKDSLSNGVQSLAITLSPSRHEYLYKDSVTLSVDNPYVTLSEWQPSHPAASFYDPHVKAAKQIFDTPITLHVTAHYLRSDIQDAHLHVAYANNTKRAPREHRFALLSKTRAETDTDATHLPQAASDTLQDPSCIESCPSSWGETLSGIVKKTDSLWIRLILVLLLGVLLSLTPCIYPMIPITVGILQSSGNGSMFKSFLAALTYSLGIATTFAVFGLVAASGGQMMGHLLAQPWFVFMIVALLIYLAFSMFGMYEMYVPSFMRPKSADVKKNSMLSIFLLGAASGTFASPCLSPGLVLVLSVVATMTSKLAGFLLLFAFGFGTSLPLLIVGTFSGALSMLPQAGMWMVEVKKIFGFMLIGMSLFYLNNILPWPIIILLTALICLLGGIYYLHDSKATTGSVARGLKNIVGITAIAGSVLLFVKGYQETVYTPVQCTDLGWHHDYQKAFEQARAENKPLFVDCGARFCSLCKAIDKSVLSDKAVQSSLQKCSIVKVDGTDPHAEPYCSLCKKYNIIGLPALLMINPHTGDVIKQWGGELYDAAKEEFINDINLCCEQCNCPE